MRRDIELALADGRGVVTVAGQPRLARGLARGARPGGALARIGPGVYTAAPWAREPGVLARAAMAMAPDAVIRGAAAAALTWWPGLKVDRVEVSHRQERRGSGGLSWSRAEVPDELVIEGGGVRWAAPALSVLDLVPTMGGAAIDEALRRRAASLGQLQDALARTPGRPGNPERRLLLRDSRDEPWSEPERHLHRGVRALRLPFPYRTNHPVRLRDGLVFLDLALPDLLLDFEVDGYEYHGGRTSFERDRRRNPGLAAAGWQCVSFSALAVLDDLPWVLATIQETVRHRALLFSGDRGPRRPGGFSPA